MDTVLVDRYEFMQVCDLLVDENPWFYLAYKLYEKGFSIAEVQSLEQAYVYPRPRFDGDWSDYPPIPVIYPAVWKFKEVYGVDISVNEEE